MTKDTNVALAEQTARGTLSSEYDTMASETADARRDGTVAQAGVDVSVATARANAGETYGNGVADATRDWQQLDAWTTRHAVWGTADTTSAPNSTSWSAVVPAAESAYFSATAQAAGDEVTWWGTAYLAQVDREALAGKSYEQNLAEAVRVRDNAVEGYEEAFDLAWINALNTAVQSAMTAGSTPWHDYVGALTLADHNLVTGTRSDELTLATARNDAEKDYQSLVSDARETLLHDRAVAEIDKAHDKTEEDITAAQTKFNAREATKAPESLEYSSGFAEGFPSRPRQKVEYADPNNTGMPYTPPNYAEPPGFGLYEEGAEKPWGDLINPPSNTFGPPPPPGPTFIPWFAQGYEPEWGDNVNNPMQSMYGDAHDEYGDSVDNQWDVPGEMGYSAWSSYDLNSPTSAFGRGESQTEWETTAGGNTQTQWWNAAMPSVYAGFTGPTINGNTLVATLNNALNGAAGVDLPDPPASTLVTPPPPPEEHEGESELPPPPPPPDPTKVGGPQAPVPGHETQKGQQDVRNQTLEPHPYSTPAEWIAHMFDVSMSGPMAPGSGVMTPEAYAERVANTPMALVVVINAKTGDSALVAMPLESVKQDLREQIDAKTAQMDAARQKWLDQTGGSDADFVARLHQLEKNPYATKASDRPILDFIKYRDELEPLYMQLASVEGTEYTPNRGGATERKREDTVGNVAELLDVFRAMKGDLKAQQILTNLLRMGWKIQISDATGDISLNTKTKTIQIPKMWVGPHASRGLRTNRTAASELAAALKAAYFESAEFGTHFGNYVGDRSVGGVQMLFGTVEAILGGVLVGGGGAAEGPTLGGATPVIIAGLFMVGHGSDLAHTGWDNWHNPNNLRDTASLNACIAIMGGDRQKGAMLEMGGSVILTMGASAPGNAGKAMTVMSTGSRPTRLYVHLGDDAFRQVQGTGLLGEGMPSAAQIFLPPFKEGRIWASQYTLAELQASRLKTLLAGLSGKLSSYTHTIEITGEAAQAFRAAFGPEFSRNGFGWLKGILPQYQLRGQLRYLGGNAISSLSGAQYFSQGQMALLRLGEFERLIGYSGIAIGGTIIIVIVND